jgi:hypothetical protein
MKQKSRLWAISWIAILSSVGAPVASANGPKDASTLALKNFRQIYASLATVTGVDPSSTDVSTYYQQIAGQLPRNGTLSEFNAQTLLAATGLASAFCNHVIAADVTTGAPKAGLNAGIDFTQGPKSITTAQRTQLVQNYVTAFLQRNPTANEQQQLTHLFASQTDATNAPAQTQNAILTVCTAVGGSIEFLSN